MDKKIYLISEQEIIVLAEKISENVKRSLRSQKENKEEEEIFMDVERVAKLLQLSKQTIYGLVNQKKIPFHKRGKKLYFLKTEIINWVVAGRGKKETPEDRLDSFLIKKTKK